MKRIIFYAKLMLCVSLFTFFGLSVIQSISCFTDLMGATKIQINVTNNEEENETNNSKEVKVTQKSNQTNLAIFQCNSLNSLAFHRQQLFTYSDFLEVSTPPPEFV